jgi:hypothetical protein
MWRKNTALLLFLVLASVLVSANCATVIRKRRQSIIPVTSTPIGATVAVNGIRQGVTPLEIWLDKKERGQVIRIECPGYNPVEIRPKRQLSIGTAVGNFLLGLGPGLLAALAFAGPESSASDATAISIWVLGTVASGGIFTLIDGGKGYALSPKELNVTLTKVDGPSRVETMLVDPDDLRNIKWIRVHRD